MWCVPELTDQFIERMEDLLDLYETPLNDKEPVVCLDEKPVQLLSDAREGTPSNIPKKTGKRDFEYIRRGTANVFCGVEPKRGKFLIKVTSNRAGPEFAKVIQDITKAWSGAKKIHLVIDNLNTHKLKSLTDFFGDTNGQKIWSKFCIHYTPTHGSWLNQAEIAINKFSRECIGKNRIGEIKLLKKVASFWKARVNKAGKAINWSFTTKIARKKFRYAPS